MQVPPFLLRRLYVKGSLRNSDDGFQFEMKNVLGSGYAEKLYPIVVDGEELAEDDCSFVIEGSTEAQPFSAVTPERPFTLEMHKTTTIRCAGKRLEPGQHRVRMGFVVVGLGEMGFEVEDTIDG
jgi:hydroxymethylglutaryl-CoA reductase (NADPH)